ncbi:hypothetical protein GJ25_gp046 [Mycobacterium phage Hawkeye]|uniref:Uncharacterized protein n=1 Tax=Mycobacterium phage Hawkeye TaxID=1458711 RepID=X2KN71_9CAUD|nr:hypothetical protein GJ25_gp046 [Mycobacterium phage Hawkeye]AHN84057.1 hypothetical protein PBI_HAWKEYE_46 [Mycobacterium phage Hawkeye]
MTIKIRKVCAGHYQYITPVGNFGLTGGSNGWSIDQYTPENGTVNYGKFDTKAEADAAIAGLFS